ncbi:glycosyl transferase family 1 [Sphingobacteriaceae bacterium]|nr:glycosyl transferase family 1 [Sphingobacteriaceae bacterium]
MKILLLSDTYSEHTEKWALGLANKGVEVGLFSFNKASYEWYAHPNITVFFEPEQKINAESTLTKLAYLKYVTILKKIIKHFKPDVLHAHYATSYGLVGALSHFHPYVISSWGTDVMKFPNKNFVAKSLLKYNFKSADVLCATSETIRKCIHEVIQKDVSVVPFGVDVANFAPRKVTSLFEEGDFVLGSIKPLEELYNIDILIKSFAALRSKYPQLKLLIAGEGSAEKELRNLASGLNAADAIIFAGRIPFKEIHKYYNMIDVLVNISEYESFGVSVIEAMACEKPVIVTNVGGLKDIVKDDSLGLKVEVRNVEQTITAMDALISDKDAYNRIAKNSRKHVIENYSWNGNLDQMMQIYSDLTEKK